MVVGSSPTRGSQFFFEKGKLCCVALPFCCVVVALHFSASLGVIVHVHALHTFCCSRKKWGSHTFMNGKRVALQPISQNVYAVCTQ